MSSVQDDVIEIFFDNAKDSIGMSVESSTLTEIQSKRVVHEWARTVAGLMSGGRKDKV